MPSLNPLHSLHTSAQQTLCEEPEGKIVGLIGHNVSESCITFLQCDQQLELMRRQMNGLCFNKTLFTKRVGGSFPLWALIRELLFQS